MVTCQEGLYMSCSVVGTIDGRVGGCDQQISACFGVSVNRSGLKDIYTYH
jgi:hypothetical protein